MVNLLQSKLLPKRSVPQVTTTCRWRDGEMESAAPGTLDWNHLICISVWCPCRGSAESNALPAGSSCIMSTHGMHSCTIHVILGPGTLEQLEVGYIGARGSRFQRGTTWPRRGFLQFVRPHASSGHRQVSIGVAQETVANLTKQEIL